MIKRTVVGLVLLWAGVAAAQDQCAALPITLTGEWGSAVFDVRIADDPEERATGLMFVDEMPSREGMLFLYPDSRPVGFWMKNTLLPLDMLFVDAQGTVVRIHKNAIPGDLTLIESFSNVLAVLELNGGLTSAYGISVGTKIHHPYFDPAAVWPCAVK